MSTDLSDSTQAVTDGSDQTSIIDRKKIWTRILLIIRQKPVIVVVSLLLFFYIVLELVSFGVVYKYVNQSESSSQSLKFASANQYLAKASQASSFSIVVKGIYHQQITNQIVENTEKLRELEIAEEAQTSEVGSVLDEDTLDSTTSGQLVSSGSEEKETLPVVIQPSPTPTTSPKTEYTSDGYKYGNTAASWLPGLNIINGSGKATTQGQSSNVTVKFQVSTSEYSTIEVSVSGVCNGSGTGSVSYAKKDVYDYVDSSGEVKGTCNYQGQIHKVEASFSIKINIHTGQASGYWYNLDNGKGLSTGAIKGDWNFTYDPQLLQI